MIEHPVYKERFHYNIISKFSVSKPKIEREIAEPPKFGSMRALLVLDTF